MDRQRGSSLERGYGRTWRKFRDRWLIEHPLCAYCLNHQRVTPASVVDHIEPHRGDMAVFWRVGNHQSLCSSCHSSVKQREEQKRPE